MDVLSDSYAEEPMYALDSMRVYAAEEGGATGQANSIQGPPNSLLYINGLTKQWTQDLLRDLFGQFGEITEVRYQRRGRKFAHVGFSEQSSAEQALVSLNGCRVQLLVSPESEPHTLQVSYAKHDSDDEAEGNGQTGGTATADADQQQDSLAAAIQTAKEKGFDQQPAPTAAADNKDDDVIIDSVVESTKKKRSPASAARSTRPSAAAAIAPRRTRSRSRSRERSPVRRPKRVRSRSPVRFGFRAGEGRGGGGRPDPRDTYRATSRDRDRDDRGGGVGAGAYPTPTSMLSDRAFDRRKVLSYRDIASQHGTTAASLQAATPNERSLIYEQLKMLEQQQSRVGGRGGGGMAAYDGPAVAGGYGAGDRLASSAAAAAGGYGGDRLATAAAAGGAYGESWKSTPSASAVGEVNTAAYNNSEWYHRTYGGQTAARPVPAERPMGPADYRDRAGRAVAAERAIGSADYRDRAAGAVSSKAAAAAAERTDEEQRRFLAQRALLEIASRNNSQQQPVQQQRLTAAEELARYEMQMQQQQQGTPSLMGAAPDSSAAGPRPVSPVVAGRAAAAGSTRGLLDNSPIAGRYSAVAATHPAAAAAAADYTSAADTRMQQAYNPYAAASVAETRGSDVVNYGAVSSAAAMPSNGTSSSSVRDLVGPLRNIISAKQSQQAAALASSQQLRPERAHSNGSSSAAAAAASVEQSSMSAATLDMRAKVNDKTDVLAQVLAIQDDNKDEDNVKENLGRLMDVLNHGQCTPQMSGALFGVLHSLTDGCKKLMVDKKKLETDLEAVRDNYKKKIQAAVTLLSTIDEVMILTKQPKHFEAFSRPERVQISQWAADIKDCLGAHEDALTQLRSSSLFESGNNKSTGPAAGSGSQQLERDLLETRSILSVVQNELSTRNNEMQRMRLEKKVLEETLVQRSSQRPTLLASGVAQGTQTEEAACSVNSLKIAALITPYLSVHPRGNTDLQLAAYLQQFMQGVTRAEVEEALALAPQLFTCNFDGHARRWYFVGFDRR